MRGTVVLLEDGAGDVVWCAAGVKGGFTLGVELHQESALSPCLQDFFFRDG